MPSFSVEFKPSAKKELEKLSEALIARMIDRIGQLAEEPRPRGCRKLHGFKDLWRIRVGDYRVVYIVDSERNLVSITRIAHRRDVYDL